MDRFLAQIEQDLRHPDDDQAYGRLLRRKVEVMDLARRPRYASDPLIVRLQALLRDIPAGATCECCGYTPLIRVHRVNGHIVGPECANHELGSCRP